MGQTFIEVAAYSFSAHNEQIKIFNTNKAFLDILFQHSRTAETVTMRTLVPAQLLCGSNAQSEAAVHSEISSVFHFQAAGIV